MVRGDYARPCRNRRHGSPVLPLPVKAKQVMDESVRPDRKRREALDSDGAEASLFHPVVNNWNPEFAKRLSTKMLWNIYTLDLAARLSTPSSPKLQKLKIAALSNFHPICKN